MPREPSKERKAEITDFMVDSILRKKPLCESLVRLGGSTERALVLSRDMAGKFLFLDLLRSFPHQKEKKQSGTKIPFLFI